MRFFSGVLLLCAVSASAQPDDNYRRVARLLWVVSDVERTADAWRRIGVPVDEAAAAEFRAAGGGGHRALAATGHFANLRVDWLQPADAAGPLAGFLRTRGAGVYALVYEMPGEAALKRETGRYESLGVRVLEQGEYQIGEEKTAYALLDTAAQGKIVLALMAPRARASGAPATMRISQLAFVTRDPEPVSAFWAKLGFPPFTFTRPDISDRMYRRRAAVFDMRLGWQRHAQMPFEWIQPLAGPNVYEDHMARHGEGFHHLAFDVEDMDAAIRRWESLGYPVTMSGAWGERGRAGSGRFAYVDAHPIGGTDIELLWNYRAPAPPPAAGPFVLRFGAGEPLPEHRLPVARLGWPTDWRSWQAIQFEFTASSLEAFSFGFSDGRQVKSAIIEPLPGLRIRAVIPFDTFYQTRTMTPLLPLGYKVWPERLFTFERVEEIVVRMKYPAQDSTLTISNLALTEQAGKDDILDRKPVIDAFGQWIPEDWPGKAHSLEELKKLWAEDRLPPARYPDYCPVGGYRHRTANPADAAGKPGFFRVARIDGRWFLLDPHGHPFFSAGMDLVGWKQGSFATRVTGREFLFEQLPPPGPAWLTPGTDVSFHAANIMRRYGDNWQEEWKKAILERLKNWGFNTIGNWSDHDIATTAAMPYVIPLGGWTTRKVFPFPWDFPDVFSEEFERNVDEAARRQCAPLASDPNLIGWFIGNEPHWAREFGSLKPWAEMLLEDPEPSATKAELERRLRENPAQAEQIKRDWVFVCGRKYFETIVAAIRRHDPNHLILGIRYAGTPLDEWVKMSTLFDVFSINIYDADFRPDPAKLDRYAQLSGKPILIGEFTACAPGRGLQGLFYWTHKVKDQTQRGIAYRYYVENAAAHPAVIGAHWFQLVDDLPTGRPSDLERLNYGFLNVLDLPYKPLVEYARETHRRLYSVKLGKEPPYLRKPLIY
jgi:catechol 2,3-dioxygenase-like lactoylglutathione lyase family enzyme